MSVDGSSIAELEQEIDTAVAEGKLTESASENLRIWLHEPRYREYADQVHEHITGHKWQELDDAFWTVIPFGTGGRRGKMYPIGSNAINDRTIGESAQGVAEYVKEAVGAGEELACAIAYDTRHRSRHFACLCAEIMVAAGFKVYFLDGYRSTPELSFAVRHTGSQCGIMVTASHNPPSDNAVKVYWSTGGQVLPPHDKKIIDRVMNVDQIQRVCFDDALKNGRVQYCQEEVDTAFLNAVAKQSIPGPRELKVIYSPLHGVGTSAISPVLAAAQFTDVEIFAPHAEPDGDFPNVPGHVSNPENAQVFDAIIERGREIGADLVLASDPDCDRIGCAAPVTPGSDEWKTLSGNQIGSLLADFILEHATHSGGAADGYIVKTLVTTALTDRIAASYGIEVYGDLLVGFKWIAGVIEAQGPDRFLYGTEESHGYLAGTHVRDKDGAVAALLMCELAAKLKQEGETLHQKLESLMWQHGAHAERTVSVQMPGSEGMTRMKEVMAAFRDNPPRELAKIKLARKRDYLRQEQTDSSGSKSPLPGPQGDLIILDLEQEGNYIAVRPSGTEPKIKFYMFTYTPPEQLANLESACGDLEQRLSALESDLKKFAGVS